MKVKYAMCVIRKSRKPLLAWWTTYLIIPIVEYLTWIIANFTNITPNIITIASFACGIISAAMFLQGEYKFLFLGAIFYELSYLLDCSDGLLARLTNQKSKFGMYLDGMLDNVRILIATICLVYGQYVISNDVDYLILGMIYPFICVLHWLGTYILAWGNSEFNYIKLIKTSGKFGFVKSYFNSRGLREIPSFVEADVIVFFLGQSYCRSNGDYYWDH